MADLPVRFLIPFLESSTCKIHKNTWEVWTLRSTLFTLTVQGVVAYRSLRRISWVAQVQIGLQMVLRTSCRLHSIGQSYNSEYFTLQLKYSNTMALMILLYLRSLQGFAKAQKTVFIAELWATIFIRHLEYIMVCVEISLFVIPACFIFLTSITSLFHCKYGN